MSITARWVAVATKLRIKTLQIDGLLHNAMVIDRAAHTFCTALSNYERFCSEGIPQACW